MTRKRERSKSAKQASDAIPDEILAEGSGPNEVVDANAQNLVKAAEDLVEKRRVRNKPKGKPADAIEPVSAASDLDATDAENVELADDVAQGAQAGDPDPLACDAAGEAPPPGEVAPASAEGEAVAAVEDAVLRAEAEAELGEAEAIEAVEEDELGAALPTTAASMDAAQLRRLVEALVFAADKPLTVQRLRQLTRVGDIKRLEQALAELAADYANRGIALQSVSGGYQFRTNTSFSVWVQQLIAGRPVRLSRAQLETLAIVAYRQPITRPEIDEIRGVDSSATLRLLLDRSLIRTLGKKEDVGRPMLYGTTKEFLDFFSLSDLRELPTLREYSELTAESRKVMTDRLGIEVGDDAGDVAVSERDAWGQIISAAGDGDASVDEAHDAPVTGDVSSAEAGEATAADVPVADVSAATSEVSAADRGAMPADSTDSDDGGLGARVGAAMQERAGLAATDELGTSDGEAESDDSDAIDDHPPMLAGDENETSTDESPAE